MRLSLAAAFLAAMTLPLASVSVHAMEEAAPAADPNLAAATALAKLLNESGQIETQIDRLLAGIAQQAFASDPDLASLNQEYPGTDKVFLDTLRPIMREELYRVLPQYNAATAQFFVSNFTPAEIRELTAFWRSPAGQEVLHQVSSNIDFSSVTKEIVDQMPEGDIQISRAAVDADKRKAATQGMRDLPREHRAAVIRFSLTPTGRKMAKLLPQKNQLDQKWANREPSPEAIARMERELPEALLAFMEAEDLKRAGGQK